ncbi:MAG TPA: hemerythrin domain-containing protein [Thermoanaerobaculia bacterium]|jgi:hemerythrin-like domain-containing protein|nr:hemerythrin domain-containing protein [Thermoanaerobaculia bacterium]
MAATKKTASKKSAKAKPADAIALLKEDHRTVMGLLESLERATGARRTKLLGQIEQELQVHTQIEEEIFYPAYRDAGRKKDDQTMYYEAVEEHNVVKAFLPEAKGGANKEAEKAKAKVLKELVEHHAEEEEKEMFPRARQVMERDELRELGERMAARKKELTGK